jgi:hypothetical protein
VLVALLALLNLGLVVFDLSYIRFRDIYLRYLPQLTQQYDPIKGIEPHRDTAQYLAVVDRLETMIAQQGLQSAQVKKLLAELGDRSATMIEEDPFRIANKSGSLEKLKNRMRQHMDLESARGAFHQFWSTQHLTPQNWRTELTFFNRTFRPLIAANYFRPIDESGDFVDRFWLIDIWFMGCFAVDLFIRILWIRQRYRTTWRDALLWRWYDLLLLLPFWQIVRIVPVAIRLHQAGLVNLNNIQEQVNRNIAENIAGEVTELVLIQSFSIVQGSIQQGILRQWLKTSPTMVDTNQVNELGVISQRVLEVVSQSVLPKLQPDLEALLRHFMRRAIAQAPLYSTLQPLLGLDRLADELAKQAGPPLLSTLSAAIDQGIADETGQQLVEQLGQHLLTHLFTELTQQHTLEGIETLLIEWIEELKLTILQRLEDQSQQQIVAEAASARRLRETMPITVLPQSLPR